MCLSGEITNLSPHQWDLVEAAISLYRKAATTIKFGRSRHFGNLGPSWRHPRGWQAVRRVSHDGQKLLAVLHTYADAPSTVSLSLPAGVWEVSGQLSETKIAQRDDTLIFTGLLDFQGAVALLTRIS